VGKVDDGVGEDRYALDQAGIRRFIRAGDPVPEGWRVEEPEPPKRKPKRAVPKGKDKA